MDNGSKHKTFHIMSKKVVDEMVRIHFLDVKGFKKQHEEPLNSPFEGEVTVDTNVTPVVCNKKEDVASVSDNSVNNSKTHVAFTNDNSISTTTTKVDLEQKQMELAIVEVTPCNLPTSLSPLPHNFQNDSLIQPDCEAVTTRECRPFTQRLPLVHNVSYSHVIERNVGNEGDNPVTHHFSSFASGHSPSPSSLMDAQFDTAFDELFDELKDEKGSAMVGVVSPTVDEIAMRRSDDDEMVSVVSSVASIVVGQDSCKRSHDEDCERRVVRHRVSPSSLEPNDDLTDLTVSVALTRTTAKETDHRPHISDMTWDTYTPPVESAINTTTHITTQPPPSLTAADDHSSKSAPRALLIASCKPVKSITGITTRAKTKRNVTNAPHDLTIPVNDGDGMHKGVSGAVIDLTGDEEEDEIETTAVTPTTMKISSAMPTSEVEVVDAASVEMKAVNACREALPPLSMLATAKTTTTPTLAATTVVPKSPQTTTNINSTAAPSLSTSRPAITSGRFIVHFKRAMAAGVRSTSQHTEGFDALQLRVTEKGVVSCVMHGFTRRTTTWEKAFDRCYTLHITKAVRVLSNDILSSESVEEVRAFKTKYDNQLSTLYDLMRYYLWCDLVGTVVYYRSTFDTTPTIITTTLTSRMKRPHTFNTSSELAIQRMSLKDLHTLDALLYATIRDHMKKEWVGWNEE